MTTPEEHTFRSRKFILAGFFTITGAAALFLTDAMDGAQYVALAGVVLALYGAGSVGDKAVRK
jgi:hypothetical protein